MTGRGEIEPSDGLIVGTDPSRAQLRVERKTVSGTHCRLMPRADGPGVFVEDLGSRNGTWVGGERLSPGAPSTAVEGDWIGLGRYAGFELTGGLIEIVERSAATLDDPVTLSMRAPPPSLLGALGIDETDLARERKRTHSATRQISSEELESAIRRGAILQTQQESERGAGGPATIEDAAVGTPDRHAALDDPTDESGLYPAPKSGALLASLSFGYAASNDVQIPNPVVSESHARIYFDGREFVLEDQTSTNGTFVSGRRIHRVPIEPGATFFLGSYRVVFDESMADRLRGRREQLLTGQQVAPEPTRTFTVGRDAENDVVLSAPQVSAYHAEVEWEPVADTFVVRDLGSTNGTYLNSRDNRVEVANATADDVVFFGSYRFPLARVAELLGHGDRHEQRFDLPDRERPLVIGRDPELADIHIGKPQVSRRHAELRRLTDGRYQLRDLGSANGTYVNGRRLREPAVIGPDDVVSLGSHQLRLDPEHGVLHKDYHGDIMIQASHVSVDVRDKSRPDGKKRILDDVSFTVYPTEFVGLLGPSGAGKTTLIMALNGYLPPSVGKSRINGVDLYENYDAFRGNIGYVPQDDIVYPQLTVYESLYYTARLRLPSDTSREEIDAKIDRILDDLEIQQSRDVLIGDAVKKGISGGQRKRVNLAQELITEPSLLFLDEPTSGLASEDTINVMNLLRRLADSGKTIILTIHQPSLEAYRKMDNVIYLFQGELVYYGPAYPDSILFFQDRVVAGPERDRILADPGNALKPLAADQREALEDAAPDEREVRLAEAADRRRQRYAESKYHTEYVDDRAEEGGGDVVELTRGRTTQRPKVDGVRQATILAARNLRVKWKDTLNTTILMVQAPIIAGVLALVFAARGATSDVYVDGLFRGPSALFLLVASAVWFGCSNSAREIVGELAIYRRERMVNLRIPSYVLAKFAVLGAVCAAQCLVLLAMVYFPLGLEGGFGLMYVILLASSLAGLGMGLTLSAVVTSGEAAVALVPLLLIPQIILGGVIMPVHQLHPSMRLLSSAMAARWGYEAMLYAEYADDDLAAIREHCGIPACVWGLGPAGFTYYPGDPDRATEPVEVSGVDALQGGHVPPVEPESDADLCHAFCVSLQNGQEITPIDRSFGADPTDPVRARARDAIPPRYWTAPEPHVRTSLGFSLGVLAFFDLLLFALVCAVLKFRDVAVS